MKIKIAGKVFEIHFLFEKEYLPFFQSYIVDEDIPDFYIYQEPYEEDMVKGDLKIESKRYDMYELNGVDIHYHKNEEDNSYIGKIIYKDNVIFSSKNLHDVELNTKLLHYIVTKLISNTNNCALLIGTAVSYNGKGILLFSTGSEAFDFVSLWSKYNDIVYVNSCFNFVIKDDNKLYLYGNPWCKKDGLNNNIIVELSNVIFLYSDKKVSSRKLDSTESFLKITNHIVTPQDERALEGCNEVLNSLVNLNNFVVYTKQNKKSIDVLKKIVDVL